MHCNEQGVPAYSGSCSEVYLEHAFDNTGFRPASRLPVARELGENSLMFLVHPTLEKVAHRQDLQGIGRGLLISWLGCQAVKRCRRL